MESIFAWIAHYGYLGIFALLMLGIVGVPVPDETLLMFTGYLVFKQKLALFPTLISAFLGSLCGISVSYVLGRTLGLYLLHRVGHFLHLDAAKLDDVRAWYDRRGKYALVVAYFIPGIRHLAAYVAGSAELPLTVFAPFASIGGLLWCSSFITLGYFLGDEWARLSGTLHRYLIIGACMAVMVGAIIFVLARRRQQSMF
jgi:membrane protein DedA with SNARE-associated domain